MRAKSPFWRRRCGPASSMDNSGDMRSSASLRWEQSVWNVHTEWWSTHSKTITPHSAGSKHMDWFVLLYYCFFFFHVQQYVSMRAESCCSPPELENPVWSLHFQLSSGPSSPISQYTPKLVDCAVAALKTLQNKLHTFYSNYRKRSSQYATDFADKDSQAVQRQGWQRFLQTTSAELSTESRIFCFARRGRVREADGSRADLAFPEVFLQTTRGLKSTRTQGCSHQQTSGNNRCRECLRWLWTRDARWSAQSKNLDFFLRSDQRLLYEKLH